MNITRNFKSYMAIVGVLGLFGGAAVAVHNFDAAASVAPAESATSQEFSNSDSGSATDPGATDAPGSGPAGSVDPRWVSEAIADLEDNLEELRAQQEAERREAAQTLQLAPGAQFGPPESFDHLEQQLDDLQNGRILTDDAGQPEDPLLCLYEEDFFGSLMAIDWRCSWVSTGVNQVNAGNEAGVAETVDILRSFPESRYGAYWVNFEVAIDHHIDPLLEGDTSGAEEFLESTCPTETIVD
ncbi:hypothetical protein [Pseudactinotalea sp. Z1748]|uniref:hypothetical protein n=1 Tax=Pseudactinotalea sp. Z1748 TaxID=3413027 RepID=UPI003C79EB39